MATRRVEWRQICLPESEGCPRWGAPGQGFSNIPGPRLNLPGSPGGGQGPRVSHFPIEGDKAEKRIHTPPKPGNVGAGN